MPNIPQEIQELLDRLEIGDPAIAMEFSPFFWALYNQIVLPDGIFSLSGRGYQIEPFQSTARRLCARKATQGGWTLLEVLRAFHKLLKQKYKKGILYLFPTDDEVGDFSATRFKPLIKDNYQLIGQYVTSDTNREHLKRMGSGYIYFRGARLQKPMETAQSSSSKLKSIPVDEVIFDEYDEMNPAARGLAIQRMADSPFKHETYLANPTIPDTGIDRLYEHESDRRIYLIKCEHCGHETCMELEFPDCLKKRKVKGANGGNGGTFDSIGGYEVYRACSKCGKEIFSDNGRWEARSPEKSEYMHGYWNSQIIQPNTDLNEFLHSWETLELQQNVIRATTDFYNLRLGMAYIAAEDRLTPNDVYNVCTLEPMLSGFQGPCAMGVDIGTGVGSIKHCVIGYRPNESSLKICKLVQVSNFNDIWYLTRKFNVHCIVLDAAPEKTKVIELIDDLTYEGFACTYDRSQRTVPNWDSKQRTVKINRTDICDATHNLITVPGRISLPHRNDELEIYAKQMSNIAKVLKVDEISGSREFFYRRVGSGQDHYRHATNYFLLAADRIGIAVKPAVTGFGKDKWAMDDEQVQGSFLGM